MLTADFTVQMNGLPEPERDADFYERVPTKRSIAWMIDVLIVLTVGVPVAVLFGIFTLGFGFALFPFVLAGIGLFYRWVTYSASSATWGMQFMGIEFRRHDGTRLDSSSAFLHAAIYIICMTIFPLQLVSCASILATRYRQSIADVMLRTAAINRPVD
jgi:uncharacterized RDD family membrane protein YckC